MSQSKQSAGRRLSIITIDQVIAGTSNVLTAIIAARILGVEGFGLFGVVFLTYVTMQGIVRALVCDPLLIHPAEVEERQSEAIGTAALLGIIIGGIVCLLGLVAAIWSRELGGAMIVLGVCMPLMGLEDFGRYLGFTTQRPASALTLDLTWLVLMVAALGVMIPVGAQSLTWFIGAWAGSGAAAGLLMLWQNRAHPMRLSLSWLRETWTFSWRYLLAFSATQGGTLVSSIGLIAIAGAQALGAVRGALLLVRPMVTFHTASVAAGVSEISNLPAGADIGRHVSKTTALTAVVAAANMAVMLLLPDPLGRMVLGDTWEVTKPLLLPAGIQIVLLALISGPRSAMLGMRLVRITVRIDIASTILIVGGTLCGAVVDAARGAFWANAIAQAVITAVWWIVYGRYTSGVGLTPTTRNTRNSPHPSLGR